MAANTRQKLLDTAETLFSQQGISATPLRQITEQAGANLAAVNYHFGSKLELACEVLRRRLDELNQERIARLDQLEQEPRPPTLEQLLEALIEPALVMSRDDNLGGMRFVRLMARAYAENDRKLHHFMREHYSHVMRRFSRALARALPAMDAANLRWHLDFVIGALTYAMADFSGHFSHMNQIHIDATVIAQHLVRFAAAGLSAADASSVDPHQGSNINADTSTDTPATANSASGTATANGGAANDLSPELTPVMPGRRQEAMS